MAPVKCIYAPTPAVAKAAVCSKAVVLLLLLINCNSGFVVVVVVDILFNVLPIVCGCFVLVLVLVYITLSPFLFCNHLQEEERGGCFLLLSYGCLVTVSALWPFLTVPWVVLRCVIVVFPIILIYILDVCRV